MTNLEGVSLADALYDEPVIGCEKCGTIGSDENAHFWCHACDGKGWVVDAESVDSLKDEAAGAADVVFAWLRSNRSTLWVIPQAGSTTFDDAFDALLDAAQSLGVEERTPQP